MVSMTLAACAAMVVVQAGFGGYGIVLKMFAQAAHANAVVFSFFRDGCCFPCLLLAATLIEGGPKVPKSKREFLVFLGLGVTGMWGNQLFYILGLYYTSATVASCWQPSIPVFASFFAIILGVEPFPPLRKPRGWLKLLGILCAAGGALVLATHKPSSGGYKLDAGWPSQMPREASSLSAVGVDHLASDGTEIYISARGPHLKSHKPILVFSEEGKLLRSWGANSTIEHNKKDGTWGAHGLSVKPAADGGTQVWIADFDRHQVSLFDPLGKQLGKSLGQKDKISSDASNVGDLGFGGVADIAFGALNSVYIADGDCKPEASVTDERNLTTNHRFLKVEAADWTKPTIDGSKAKLDWVAGNNKQNSNISRNIHGEEMTAVHSVAYHSRSDTIFVVDREQNRILHASATGELLGVWGPGSCLNFGKDASPYGVRVFEGKTKYDDLIIIAASVDANSLLANVSNAAKPGRLIIMNASEVADHGPGPCKIKLEKDLTKQQCATPHLLGINAKSGDIYLACVGGKVGDQGNRVLRFKAGDGGKKAFLGNIFLLINCCCMALYINIQKVFIFQAPDDDPMAIYKKFPTHVTAWSYMFGAIWMIITAVLGYAASIEFLGFGKHKLTDSFAVPSVTLIPLVYAVLISSALCYGLITFANKHLSASFVTVFWPLQVPVAVLLASCPVGIFYTEDSGKYPTCENITSGEGVGALLIVLGLFSCTLADSMERQEKKAEKEGQAPLLSTQHPSSATPFPSYK